ncbi:TWiK family of potassium channels protein 7 [Drosophila guanche]|uniref:Blast:TWiK family of potassium channels protein 18 n=1 Tax=Drosophila guanche TaxID=7266 RepID=A0A3B0J957_DROGU|nr:TWiK family of potassium channels protein 7 [Drosophila guanche]SPP78794.1 blast:TWiK family of potassium channels protein 18 [Drosophila guanche]
MAAFLGNDISSGSPGSGSGGGGGLRSGATAAAAATAALNGGGRGRGRQGGGEANGGTGSAANSGPSSKSEKQDDSEEGGIGILCGCGNRAPKSHCISATGVLLLVLLYTAMGSIIFVTLEGELEDGSAVETAVAASKPYPRTELANAEIRSRTVDRLWSITEDLNILYKENWTRLAAQEVQLFQDTLLRAVRQSKVYPPGGIQLNAPTHKWTYASAFLYSMTLITTIGYGGVSPRTQWGRIAALIYALLGIPIILLYLSAMGDALSTGMRCLFRRQGAEKGAAGEGDGGDRDGSGTSGNGRKSDKKKGQKGHYHGGVGAGGGASNMHYGMPQTVYQQQQQQQQQQQEKKSSESENEHGNGARGSASVPISICVCVMVCYVTSGAILFHRLQNWSVLESLYFCFTSLGTIGFGELAPRGTLALYMASAYILVGMAVVAMCFNLIQAEIVHWLRKFSVQDHVTPKPEEVTLVSVSVTPKPS